MAATLEQHFGSAGPGAASSWRAAQSLAHGSGWVLLTYSRRARRFWNQIAADHSQAAVDAAPVLVLDMYEHAYHLDFGANATAYIDAFMRNIDWAAVTDRMDAVRGDAPLPLEDPSDESLPSLSVEELAAQLAKGEPVQVLDARPRHHISRTVDLMDGAVWRDPDRVETWIGELSPGPAGGGLLRLRVSCGLQHHADAPGPWARRPVRPRRRLGLVCHRRRARDAAAGARRMTARAPRA